MSDRVKTSADETSDFKYYLPGSSKQSSEPGRFGQFVQKLFRRRGGLVPVARRRKSN